MLLKLSSSFSIANTLRARGVYSTRSDFTEILTRSQMFALCPVVPEKNR